MPIPTTKEGRKIIWENCVRIEKNGGDVLSYLKSEGYISLRGAWFNLQVEFSNRKRSQFTDGRPVRRGIMSKKITLGDKKNTVKVALDGGNPEEYLRSLGIKDTRQTWYRIKADLKKADPETWEKLNAMKKQGRRKKEPEPKEAEGPVPDPVPEPKNDNPAEIVEIKDKFGYTEKIKLFGQKKEGHAPEETDAEHAEPGTPKIRKKRLRTVALDGEFIRYVALKDGGIAISRQRQSDTALCLPMEELLSMVDEIRDIIEELHGGR